MRYACVILGEKNNVLCVCEGEKWSLPYVECDADWLPDAVSDIQGELARRFGLSAFVLRELERSDEQAFAEVEALGSEVSAAAGAAWCGATQAMARLPPEQGPVVRACFEPPPSVARLGPWQMRGWFEAARSWMLSAAAAAGFSPEGQPPRIQQVKGAWNMSAVLELATSAGSLYFKAVPERVPGEAMVVATLGERHPVHVPHLVASDPARGFSLMREVTGLPLDHEDGASLASAMRLMASIQIEESKRLDRWRELGCADHGLDVLEARLYRLLCEIPSRLEKEGLIDAEEEARLCEFMPHARLLCQRLQSLSPVPCSIHQEDFRAGNVYRAQEGVLVIIDWNETVLSHPFFSAQRLIWFIEPPEGAGRHHLREHKSDRLRCALRDAYLEPFASLASRDELREAFRISCLLAPLYDELRFDAAGDIERAIERGLLPEEKWIARGLIDQLMEVSTGRERGTGRALGPEAR